MFREQVFNNINIVINLVMVLDFLNLITVDISLGTVINKFHFIKFLS